MMNSDTIKRLESACQEALTANPELKPHIGIDHFFIPGMYGRRMSAAAGTYISGATHKYPHFAILLEGEVVVMSKNGRCKMVAPYIVQSAAGDKRSFLAITDITWMTIHATDETDIPTLEDTLVEEELM